MRAELLSTFDRQALMADWTRLYARGAPNFFQSPPFIAQWLDAAGPDMAALRVSDERGAAIALAFVGLSQRGEARFAETGRRAFDRLYVEYADFLLDAAAVDAARDAGLDALIAGAPAAAEFVFRNARPALAEACARAASRNGLALRVLLTQPTFQVALRPGGGDAAQFSQSLRAKIRRSLRRYEERGAVSLTAATTGAERAEALKELVTLHKAAWTARGEPGAFELPELFAFHARLTRAAPEATDLLRFAVAGETVGVLYNFIARDRVYNYQSGFRFEADNQLAPGFTAHALAIDHYRKAGFQTYDLMAGEADYKRRLGREGETLTSLVIERRSVLQRAKSLARRFRRARMRQT